MSTSETKTRREIVEAAARAVKPMAALADLIDDLQSFDDLQREIGNAQLELKRTQQATAENKAEGERLARERRAGLEADCKAADERVAAAKAEALALVSAAKDAADKMQREARDAASRAAAEAAALVQAAKAEAQQAKDAAAAASAELVALSDAIAAARDVIDRAEKIRGLLP